jgi:prephenate dehydratase
MVQAAFQGVRGAYSEAAARRFFGPRCTTLPCESFEDVFEAVSRRRAEAGVIPIENSLAGSIHQNYDLLRSHRLHIVGETSLGIEHTLMAPAGVSSVAVRFVRSHPQALAQCSDFFRSHRSLRPVPYFDTAGAAKSLSHDPPPATAAIAHAYAARLYGLKILRRNIANRERNVTRFLILSRTPWHKRTGVQTKTSILFAPARNQVGILFRILGVFALREIDLLKIESRPDLRSTFQYLFYLDLAGDPSQQHVARALEHLQEMVTSYRLLGVYPRSV